MTDKLPKDSVLERKVDKIITLLDSEKRKSSVTQKKVILQAIAYVILFGSWISQNYFLDKWKSQKEEQEDWRRVGMMTHILIKMSDDFGKLFGMKYGEDTSRNYVAKAYLNAQKLGLLQSQNDQREMLAEMLAVDEEKYDKTRKKEFIDGVIRLREEFLDSLFRKTPAKFNSFEIKRIDHLNDSFTKFNNRQGFELVKDINTYKLKLINRINFYSNLFFCLYIFGSVLLAISFCIEHFHVLEKNLVFISLTMVLLLTVLFFLVGD